MRTKSVRDYPLRRGESKLTVPAIMTSSCRNCCHRRPPAEAMATAVTIEGIGGTKNGSSTPVAGEKLIKVTIRHADQLSSPRRMQVKVIAEDQAAGSGSCGANSVARNVTCPGVQGGELLMFSAHASTIAHRTSHPPIAQCRNGKLPPRYLVL